MALTQIVTTDSVSASVVNTKIVDPANLLISTLEENQWKLTDDVTAIKYEFGISNSAFYYREVV